jgi:ribosomal protein S18 acetylase RimI-like enzyme
MQIAPTSTKIKPASRIHLSQLRAMMRQLHAEHHQREPDQFKTPEDVEKSKDIATYYDDPNCLIFVALDDSLKGSPCVGFISGHFCELTSSVSKPITMGSVDELFVLSSHRKQGIGKDLLEQLSARFKLYGASQLFVEVWHSNVGAVEMYQQFGFSHHIHWLRKPL